MKNALVIINPTSGNNSGSEYSDILSAKLEKYFQDVVIKKTEKKGDAKCFARNACNDGIDTIVGLGGDGTINEIISGMAEQEHIPKLCIIPGGTGNLLAQQLGISNDINRAIEEQEFDCLESVDIGKVNDNYFSYMLSIGVVSEAIHEISSEEKEKFGMAAYLVNTLKKLSNEKNYNLSITTDAGDFAGEVSHVIVTSKAQMKGFDFAGIESSIDDGLLHTFILKKNTLIDKFSIAKDVIFGSVEENDRVAYLSAKSIEIETLDTEKVVSDIDGDEGPLLPINIKVLPQHIGVYTVKQG